MSYPKILVMPACQIRHLSYTFLQVFQYLIMTRLNRLATIIQSHERIPSETFVADYALVLSGHNSRSEDAVVDMP